MSILTIIIVIVLVGVVLWAVNTYIPMEARLKQLLNIVVIIAVVLWLLKAFGILDSLSSVTV